MTLTNIDIEYYSEFTFPLSQWAYGTELWNDMLTKIESYAHTLQKLNEWKNNGLVFPKPTLSSDLTIFFCIHHSLVSKALKLTGIRGGFNLSSNAAILSYWGKTSIQGRRIGDLISAIYLSGWGGNKRKQNELLKDFSSLMAECIKQMFSGTDLLMGTERIPLNARQIELIIDSLEINPKEGSTKFLRKALITTLKEIYEGFVNDDL